MATIERVYNVPLRAEWSRAPPYKRAKRAIKALRTFLLKHMKVTESKNLKLGKHLNEAVWERGIKHPPHHVKVNVSKNDEGIVRAELVGFPLEEPKKEKKGTVQKLKEKVLGASGKKEEKKAPDIVDVTPSSVKTAPLDETIEKKPKRAPRKKAATASPVAGGAA